MIKLKRPNKPQVLDVHGNCKLFFGNSDLCFAYDLASDDFEDGVEEFRFDNKIYGHSNVKDSLRRAQNGKCAFCEQNVSSVDYGDIEHFRPKGGYKQNAVDSMHQPGYYWLSYEWENLMYVCKICNQGNKKNLFPIRRPEYRAHNHYLSHELKKEKPFFVNPYKEDPKNLIEFNQEIASGKDKNHRGKKTIEMFGLNRSGNGKGFNDIYELRKDHYVLVNQTHKISQKVAGGDFTQAEIDEAGDLMDTFREKGKQFSAMVNDNFPA